MISFSKTLVLQKFIVLLASMLPSVCSEALLGRFDSTWSYFPFHQSPSVIRSIVKHLLFIHVDIATGSVGRQHLKVQVFLCVIGSICWV